ncbi:MAG TPA: alpha/beta hydrolase-fold protein [Herpetosiphonaceae bacterium]
MNPADPISPRVEALRRELEADAPGALESFLAELAAGGGAPLFEPLPGDDGHVLASFFWLADAPVANVALVLSLGDWRPEEHLLAPLPGGRLWAISRRLPADLRTCYELSPDDSLAPAADLLDDEAWRRRTATWQPDPLNPRRYRVDLRDAETPDSRDKDCSPLECPAAPPQPWVAPRPGTPGRPLGRTLAEFRLASPLLGYDRRVWVYEPAGYAASAEDCNLLILFDGIAYSRLMAAPVTLDNLIAAGRIPPTVAVFLDQPKRLDELLCSEEFTAALAAELVPWIRRGWRVSADPARVIIGGTSAGGLAGAMAGLRHPELFGNVLSQSGAFWFNPLGRDTWHVHEWHAEQFAAAEPLPLRFYMDVGRLEAWPTPGGGPSLLAANRRLRDVLLAKGYPVAFAEFAGGHNYICWQGGLADGLLALAGR